ncbi:MAG: phosphatidate cytidylyltransferase [Saprospiraceae bacterium]|nr:phosphatidate cytidylyltransferase [Saprospiraceae bacterium]
MTIFQQRAITAIIFAAVMLTGLFFNESSFNLLFLVISTGCVWEFLDMTLPNEVYKNVRKIIGALASVGLVLLFSNTLTGTFSPLSEQILPANNGSSSLYFILFLSFLLLTVELFLKAALPFNNVALLIFSLIYLSLPFSLLTHFTHLSGSRSFTPNVVAGVLFLTWANDSFAYIIGSKIGKTPFFLRVSPKKTWEGTIGGGVCCMIMAGIIAQFFTELELTDWLIIGGIIAVFGTIGDLVESLLKRSVGVKDSGNFMPGHGGFLDRFDAFIFCIPFVYVYLSFVKDLI